MKKIEIEAMFEFLKDNDYIAPDTDIPSDVLSSLFGISDVEDIEFVGPLIVLSKYIEKKTGLFVKLIDKGIHIFSEDEAAFISKKRAEKAQRIQKETFETLKKTPVSNISTQEKRMKHLHQINVFLMLNKNSKELLEDMVDIDD